MTTQQLAATLTPVLLSLLGLVVTALVAYLGRALGQWLNVAAAKAAHDAEVTHNDLVAQWVHDAVKWAEMTLPQSTGPTKKAAVVDFLTRQFPWMTHQEIDVLVESAVHGLQQGLAEASPGAPPPPSGPASAIALVPTTTPEVAATGR